MYKSSTLIRFVFVVMFVSLLFGCTYPNDPSDTNDSAYDDTTEDTDDTTDDSTDDTPSYYPELEISSYTLKESELDSTAIIYGVVANNGNIGSDFTEINVTLKNSSGSVIDTEFTYVDPSAVPANKEYFFTMYTDAVYSEVSSINFSLSYSSTTSDNPESGLSVNDVSEYTDYNGDVRLVGEVKNSSASLKEFCQVNVAFFDSSDSVVYCDFTFTDPSSIAGGSSKGFELYTNIEPDEYDYYSIYASSSDNY